MDAPPVFHLLAKPTGAVCNLDCKYCYFLKKENLYPNSNFQMSDEILKAYTQQHIAAQRVPEVTFAWQGGEPTLLGIDYFRSITSLQEKYADGKTVTNTIQTNGTLDNCLNNSAT